MIIDPGELTAAMGSALGMPSPHAAAVKRKPGFSPSPTVRQSCPNLAGLLTDTHGSGVLELGPPASSVRRATKLPRLFTVGNSSSTQSAGAGGVLPQPPAARAVLHFSEDMDEGSYSSHSFTSSSSHSYTSSSSNSDAAGPASCLSILLPEKARQQQQQQQQQHSKHQQNNQKHEPSPLGPSPRLPPTPRTPHAEAAVPLPQQQQQYWRRSSLHDTAGAAAAAAAAGAPAAAATTPPGAATAAALPYLQLCDGHCWDAASAHAAALANAGLAAGLAPVLAEGCTSGAYYLKAPGGRICALFKVSSSLYIHTYSTVSIRMHACPPVKLAFTLSFQSWPCGV
jgi:hypothetical protein